MTKGEQEPKAVWILVDRVKEENCRKSSILNEDEKKSVSTFPDIIVHRRGSNKENLLVIEVKKKIVV